MSIKKTEKITGSRYRKSLCSNVMFLRYSGLIEIWFCLCRYNKYMINVLITVSTVVTAYGGFLFSSKKKVGDISVLEDK